jgi:hypothetical protein
MWLKFAAFPLESTQSFGITALLSASEERSPEDAYDPTSAVAPRSRAGSAGRLVAESIRPVRYADEEPQGRFR